MSSPSDSAHPSGDEEPVSPVLLDSLRERFDILGEAGRGGMATVWDARRKGDGKRVALKIMRRSIAQSLGTQRFLREIGIAQSVHAPTLMPLEESGEIDGTLYYVMPFADGGSLRQLIDRERQLNIDHAVRIACDVATGLSALHSEGFVHRDIKPENVLLGGNGAALLADYGIARALFAVSTDVHTSTGIVLGTPMYMSPEQAGGGAVDGRSDLYSLGCLLYEMLIGSPPFHGVSTQAVIARHMGSPPPSLRIVRTAVSPQLEAVVLRALAKVPADRFETGEAFAEALLESHAASTAPNLTTTHQKQGTGGRAVALGLAGLLSVGAIAYSLRPPTLDTERVLVFPFTDADPQYASEGERLATLVESALERTEATHWLDAFPLLADRERDGRRSLPAARARALARGEHARYYLDGSVVHARDSVTVQVVVHDASSGAEVTRRSESASIASAGVADAALKAVVQVMPALTGLSNVVDVSSLSNHNAGAVDSWLRGEREYRRSRMETALPFLEQAVTLDSSLAPAAYRAAAAASWTSRTDTALSLVRLALRHQSALSPRQRPLAKALERFLSGRADEAISALRPALSPTQVTADAWMLAGEIQLHLLPSVTIDSLARRAVPAVTVWPLEAFAHEAFENARELDHDFSPPLPHLAEIAARRGDAGSVARYTALVAAQNPDSVFATRMARTERCLRSGEKSLNWADEVRRNPRMVYRVGAVLQSAQDPRARRCALAAFSSILDAEPVQGAEYWSAMVALHGMLLAQGESMRALALVDSAVAKGLSQSVGLYVVDEAAGVDIGNRATNFVAQLAAAIDTRGPSSLWLVALSAAHAGNVELLGRVDSTLTRRIRAPTAQRLDSLIAGACAGYLALARHDTALALRRFEALLPTAAHRDVDGSLWESLAPERFTYARVLLARGQAADAYRVASTFDAPSVSVHQMFLLPSLWIRVQAARALKDDRLERSASDATVHLRALAVR